MLQYSSKLGQTIRSYERTTCIRIRSNNTVFVSSTNNRMNCLHALSIHNVFGLQGEVISSHNFHLLHIHDVSQYQQTHTQQFIIHVLVLETNMNSYIKLFSLQNTNSYIKNWANDAPFSSCPVYFSATANSRRKIGQK